MPSALETLVKILKLEREQGYKNTAVIGGLAAFGEKWAHDARAQARKPEHHMLVDELGGLLRKYESLDSRVERHNTVGYMIDRITGRAPAPPGLQPPPEAQTPVRSAPPQREQGERPARPPRREERRSDAPQGERRREGPDRGTHRERPELDARRLRRPY